MGANAYTPGKGVSIRRVESTKEDRAEYQRQWKEDRKHKEKLKEERFAAIRERRKDKPGGSGGSNGINIEVNG
ncbi:MAG: hypothetical protein GF334_04810 [Candidatus Altiarchaeales archaeon]|nr:hypothetical protein [Candidatus Altiarchaeales archaeon]